jgi:tetratricopeptide (TPR) repeat protein
VSRAPRAAIVAGLSAMVIVVFWRVAGYPFLTYDDPAYFAGNPFVPKGLTISGIRWAFTAFYAANWHPATWISHMVDVSLFGMDAGRHHLVNLLFHLANTLLLFRLLRRMTGRMWESGAVAALFAVHPLHVESVVWLAERKDVLSTFFFMLALLGYVRYCERPGFRRYQPLLLFFVLGLLSKPMLVTFPFVLLLLDGWPLGRFSLAVTRSGGSVSVPRTRLLLEKLPLIALSAASCVVTYLAQRKGDAVTTLAVLPLYERCENGLLAVSAYLGKFAWPSGLAFLYPLDPKSIAVWKVAGSGLLLLFVTAAACRNARRFPFLLTGWFWYLGTLLPVAGIVQVGVQSMADRYTYIPLIGIFVMVAWGVGESGAWRRIPGAATAAAAMLLLAVLAARASSQVGYWRDSGTLYAHTLEVTRDNWAVREVWGMMLLQEGRLTEAEAQFREIVLARPDRAEGYYELGKAMSRPETVQAAIARFEDALRIRPDYAEAHNDLGAALARAGRTREAIAHYREALRYRPEFADAHYNLGQALSRQGGAEEAVAQFREAIRIRQDFAEAHNNLGTLLAGRGEFPEAVSHFREALRIRPSYDGARFNLDRVLAGKEMLRPAGRRESPGKGGRGNDGG